MKFGHLKALAIAFAASTVLAGGAQAQVSGASSDTAKVKIGLSTVAGGPHAANEVGINVPNLLPTQYIDFKGLQNVLGVDANGVTTFTAVTGTVTDHSKYGRFDFAKVGAQDLYFGEWKQTASVTAGDHTVYYGGKNASVAADIPGSGSATYTVKGISDYQNKGILNGNFTATFLGGGNGTLTGNLKNGANTYAVNIGTAVFSGPTFTGATASVTDSTGGGTPISVSGGAVNGRFFGSGLAALAGIVTFSSARHYNTAFGGTKN